MPSLDFSNYDGLVAAIGSYLNRSDADTTAAIPAWIQLCEAEIRRDVRRKTIRTTLVVAAEVTALPADVGILRSAYPTSTSPSLDLPLEITTPEALAEIRANYAGVTGRPQAIAVVDRDLLVAPAPDQSYTLQVTYYQALVALSASTETNPVLAEAPDVYLYGTLKHSAPWLVDDDRLQEFSDLYESAVAKLNKLRQDEELSAPLRRVKLPTVFG